MFKKFAPIFLSAALASVPVMAQQQQAPQDDNEFTITDYFSSAAGTVYVPRDPAQITANPAKIELVPVTFQSYTILAENSHGEHVSCAGLKIKAPENTRISYATRDESGFFLYPANANKNSEYEKSYGNCLLIDDSQGVTIRNTNIAVSTNGSHQASFNIPFFDGIADQWRKYYREMPLDKPNAPCKGAGWNNAIASAKVGDHFHFPRTALEFCEPELWKKTFGPKAP